MPYMTLYCCPVCYPTGHVEETYTHRVQTIISYLPSESFLCKEHRLWDSRDELARLVL